MTRSFRAGDLVEWNSEAGRVRGRIIKKITSEIVFKGYRRHASKDEPQYLIKSERTDHVAIHKDTALKKVGTSASSRPRRTPAGRPRKPAIRSART